MLFLALFLLLPPWIIGEISDVKVHYYTLSFSIFPETFTGHTDLSFTLLTPSPRISLHSKDLDIARVLVYQGETRRYVRATYEQVGDELQLSPEGQEGWEGTEYLLRIQYRAAIKDDLTGIFVERYRGPDGEEKTAIATHFEPIHARRAFPCFDRPHLKAAFSVSIDHDVRYRAVGNMPRKRSRSIRSNLIRTEFETTPPMSPYLLAFAVTEFEEISTRTSRGTVVRAWHKPGRAEASRQGLETAQKSIEFFEGYLGRVYPLPKLDIMPLGVFVIGGMENWGLITVREMFFYKTPDTSPDVSILQRALMAHEVAHMWFGDLVSLTTWNDLWLKEGAAQMLMLTALEDIHGQEANWDDDMKNSILPLSQFKALEYDSTIHTHPVSMNITDEDKTAAAFDAISYTKGASLLAMLKTIIGPDKFRRGVARYIRDYQYGSASMDDFLASVEAVVSDMDVSAMMREWLTKAGYPVVRVTRISPRKYRLYQSRYVESGNAPRDRWPIYVTLKTNRNRIHRFMMKTRTKVVSFNYSPRFVKFNVNATMFFRTDYDESSLKAISKELTQNHTKYFTADDRAGIVSDVIAMVTAQRRPTSFALNLLQYLPVERSYRVWMQALPYLGKVLENLSGETQSQYRRFVANLLEESASRRPSSHSLGERMLRGLLEDYGLTFGVRERMEVAERTYAAWVADPAGAPIYDDTLTYAVTHLGGSELVWQRFQGSSYPGNRKLFQSLAATNDTQILDSLMEGSLTGDWVPRQSKYEVLNAISFFHPTTALRFLMDNYEAFYELYGETQFNFGNLLSSVISNLRSREDIITAEEFFRSVNLGTGEDAYRMAMAQVRAYFKWRKGLSREVSSFLDSRSTR